MICSGYSAEWQTWGLWTNHVADYSEPGKRGYAKWLEARGKPVVEPPTAERRDEAARLHLRDPAEDADIIDYLGYANDVDAEAILHFARIAREASGGRGRCVWSLK